MILVFIRLAAFAGGYRLLSPSPWQPSKAARCRVLPACWLWALRDLQRHASLPAASPVLCSTANHAAMTLHIHAVTGSYVHFRAIGYTLRNHCLTAGRGCAHWPITVCQNCLGGWRESSERAVGCPRHAPRGISEPALLWEVPVRSSRALKWHWWYRTGMRAGRRLSPMASSDWPPPAKGCLDLAAGMRACSPSPWANHWQILSKLNWV